MKGEERVTLVRCRQCSSMWRREFTVLGRNALARESAVCLRTFLLELDATVPGLSALETSATVGAVDLLLRCRESHGSGTGNQRCPIAGSVENSSTDAPSTAHRRLAPCDSRGGPASAFATPAARHRFSHDT